MFTGVAVELDADNRIFTTLPLVPVPGEDGSGIDTAVVSLSCLGNMGE